MLAIALIAVIVVTNLLVRHTVVMPITRVTNAMKAASSGHLDLEVPVLGQDELSAMASSFNSMTKELLETYTGLHHEQNKLTTIILSTQEGIVVTDNHGSIVLVNPATESLLGKSRSKIEKDGFDMLFGNREEMLQWKEESKTSDDPILFDYNGLKLSILVSTIEDKGKVIGSSALIFDITAQKQLENELRKLSNTDGLTQLYNRRFLDMTLTKELERTNRYKTPLSALMFDVDHFKKFNDTHGHDQGDRVLQSIANTMQTTCRAMDFPCRYGGEEFLIILPNTDLEGAMLYAERLRAAIEDTEVNGLTVTVSIGVAGAADHSPRDAEHFISLCDAALYKAKEAGRNQVIMAEIKT
jgi:diguanylate cyclase (GGDEF)-like protein/PAS domain S-box-containing protein